MRFDIGDLDTVRDLAEQEAEGNVSQMLRKLVSEALRARRTTEGNPA